MRRMFEASLEILLLRCLVEAAIKIGHQVSPSYMQSIATCYEGETKTFCHQEMLREGQLPRTSAMDW